MKVAELREELKSKGLPTNGTKAEMIARLEAASSSGGGTAKGSVMHSLISHVFLWSNLSAVCVISYHKMLW